MFNIKTKSDLNNIGIIKNLETGYIKYINT